jgi:hypothetical protein
LERALQIDGTLPRGQAVARLVEPDLAWQLEATSGNRGTQQGQTW